MNELQKDLLRAAEQAARRAYAPYSSFRVGAAVLTPGGTFAGANIENASANLGICAERAAITHAWMQGEEQIIGIGVCCLDLPTGDSETVDEFGAMPCGACRQWLAELAPDAWLVISTSDKVYTLDDLLPFSFHLQRRK